MKASANGTGRYKDFLPDLESVKRIQKSLTDWYVKNHRKLPWRESGNPYYIWISEVMLQQTQVNTVIPYYQRFIKKFPDVKHLAAADLQTVLKLWEGLGYYARARNFHKAAQMVMTQHQGNVPDTKDAFKALPGVGDYIASAVLSIAFGKPYSVVDGNVKRVLARLFEMDTPVNQSSSYKIFESVAGRLLDKNDPGTFNQAVMELGALICKPVTPMCDICPLQTCCAALEHDTVGEFPVKIKKKKVPTHHLAIGVIFKNNKVLIVRRPEEKMLGGLWEFPGGQIKPNESSKAACKRAIFEKVNLSVDIGSKLTQIKHAYTHFKITADIFICTCNNGRVKLNGPTDHKWIVLKQIGKYPFPKSNHKFFKKLCNNTGK